MPAPPRPLPWSVSRCETLFARALTCAFRERTSSTVLPATAAAELCDALPPPALERLAGGRPLVRSSKRDTLREMPEIWREKSFMPPSTRVRRSSMSLIKGDSANGFSEEPAGLSAETERGGSGFWKPDALKGLPIGEGEMDGAAPLPMVAAVGERRPPDKFM